MELNLKNVLYWSKLRIDIDKISLSNCNSFRPFPLTAVVYAQPAERLSLFRCSLLVFEKLAGSRSLLPLLVPPHSPPARSLVSPSFNCGTSSYSTSETLRGPQFPYVVHNQLKSCSRLPDYWHIIEAVGNVDVLMLEEGTTNPWRKIIQNNIFTYTRKRL